MKKEIKEYYESLPEKSSEFFKIIEKLPEKYRKELFQYFNIFWNTASEVIVSLEQKDTKLEDLVNLQAELGYVKGEISTVAMLGLVGEAGEVLGEVHTVSNIIMYDQIQGYMNNAIQEMSHLESYKKLIRKEDKKFVPLFEIHPDKGEEFNKELADTFYYLQILATNRGLTILDLAQMAHDKVRANQAAGGSSEDKK